MADILVVDDDQSIAAAFQHFLRFEGHESRLASNAEDAMHLIAERQPDVIFMDIRMPGTDGLRTLEQMRSQFPDLCIIMMTAYGTSQTSIDAIRAGAFDYLTKPLDLDQLRAVIEKSLAARHASGGAEPPPVPEEPLVGLVGETAAILDVYKMIGRLATNDVPALVTGERGTGKRLVVATIHRNSARRDQEFVSVDCAALTESAIEAELFDASAGTIHLGAVDALPSALQVRLADALADSRDSRDGRRLGARIVATTEQKLADAAHGGEFNLALYEAISVITIALAPLRERREDIPLLVRHFIQRSNAELSRGIKGIDAEVTRLFQQHPWPGNVGELERVLKRACIVARGDVITADDIGGSLADSRLPGRQEVDSALTRAARSALHDRLMQTPQNADTSAFHAIVDLVETTLVDEALTITSGNQLKAAELLGVNRATVRKKASSTD